MKLSKKQLENTICLACSKPFIEHTKPSNGRGAGSGKFYLQTLLTCMFRIQGSFIEMADKQKAKQISDQAEVASEVEALSASEIGDDGTVD